jgi:hypothetical protein
MSVWRITIKFLLMIVRSNLKKTLKNLLYKIQIILKLNIIFDFVIFKQNSLSQL